MDFHTIHQVRVRINCYRDAGVTWRRLAEMPEFNGVSPATLRNIALGNEPSRATYEQLGVPTQRQCAATGWHRRAVWIHADDLPRYEAMLARHAHASLQELVDFEMMRR